MNDVTKGNLSNALMAALATSAAQGWTKTPLLSGYGV